jgi:hypothetical protein
MALRPGYYLLEKGQLGQAIPRPRETMSVIAFLRAVQREEPLPDKVCVLGLERLLYHTPTITRRQGSSGRRCTTPRPIATFAVKGQ